MLEEREDAINTLREELKDDLTGYCISDFITKAEKADILSDFDKWCEGANSGDEYYYDGVPYELKYDE